MESFYQQPRQNRCERKKQSIDLKKIKKRQLHNSFCWIVLLSVYLHCAQLLSPIKLFATPWIVARQTPLAMGFSRQEYWSRFPSPSPRDLPDPGMEPRSPALQTDSLPLSHQGSTFNRVSTVKCLQESFLLSSSMYSVLASMPNTVVKGLLLTLILTA